MVGEAQLYAMVILISDLPISTFLLNNELKTTKKKKNNKNTDLRSIIDMFYNSKLFL
jgi:hypothetical protein